MSAAATTSFRNNARKVLRVVALVVCVSVAFTTGGWMWSRLSLQKEHSTREAQMSEVTRWLMRTEDGAPVPSAIQRSSDGEPISSWRLRVVAECIPNRTHFQPELKWSDPAYKEIQAIGRDWMCRHGETSPAFVAIVGPGTAFEEGKELYPSRIPRETVLLVEVLRPGLSWMEPNDLSIEELYRRDTSSVPDYVSDRPGTGFHVAFADGSVWYLLPSVPSSTLADAANISIVSRSGRDKLLGRYKIQ